MSLDHACGNGRHSLAERGLDLYQTPSVATEALLRVEQLPHTIWEPAAGRGAIVRVLRDHGYAVIASDIATYDFPLHFQRDFLAEIGMPAGVEAIDTDAKTGTDVACSLRSCSASSRTSLHLLTGIAIELPEEGKISSEFNNLYNKSTKPASTDCI